MENELSKLQEFKAKMEEKAEKQRKLNRTFQRNRRRILKMLPPEMQAEYRRACHEAWMKGEPCPPFPGGRVSSMVEVKD